MISLLLFFGSFFLGVFLTIFSNPVYSFVLYEVVYFFSPAQRWWFANVPDLRYSFLTVALMMFALFVRYRGDQAKNKIFGSPQFKWVYLVVFLYGISWFSAVRPEDHLQTFSYFLKLLIIISIAYKLVDSVEKLNISIWGYIFGSWYISFLTYQTGRNSGDRVEGIGTIDSPDSNGIAAAIAPSLVLCLYYFWLTKRKLFKLLFAFAGIFIANALILINSRGAFLAVAVGILYFMYYMYFSSFQRKYQKLAAVMITVVGISGVISLADVGAINRLKTMQTEAELTEEQESGSTRVFFWIASLEMAQDYPFGTGYLGFDHYATYYIPEEVHTGANRRRSVHNTWLEALTEMGYLGLILFSLMIYSCFRATKKCISRLKEDKDFENYFKVIALEAALLTFMVAMTFLNRLRAEILYWLILYTACAYNIYVIKSLKDDKKSNAEKNSSLLNGQ